MFHLHSRKFRQTMLIALGLLIVLLAAGGLFAKALFAQRDFSGTIRFELCQADGAGKWRIIDTMDVQSNFSANVVEAAGGNVLTTNFVWNGRSAKGRKFTAKITRAAKASFDPTTGKLVIQDMAIEAALDGKKETVTATMTTESVEGATGTISGKRAQISNGQATLAMVGSTKLRTANLAPAGQASISGAKKVEEFLVVVKANGRLVAR
jgi:hypothetical protein